MRGWISLAVVAGFAVACSACGGGAKAPKVVTVTASAPTTSAPSFASLVSEVRSGIVRIQAENCQGGDIGTGFLLSPRLVGTVEHVVDGATAIRLKQNGETVAFGTVVGEDAARDLALIRSSKPLRGHLFALAGRAPLLGEDVAALGFPLGLPLTVTRGSVSGSDRTIPIDGLRRRDLVQTDAAVNPGNSGGPLIADDGSVVGLVDLGTSQANGLAFAVSAQVAGPLLQAWRAAPQPVQASACAGPSPPQVAAPAPSTTTASVDTYDGRNFSIIYPASFAVTAAEVNKGTYYDTTIENGDYLLRVDENPTGGSIGLDAAAAPVLKALRAESGYVEISLQHTSFEGYPALRWEFEVPENGVLLHKTDTFFIGDHGTGWAILAQAPAAAWDQVAPAFDEIEGSFVEKN